ncbi:MAG: glutamine synthetase III [Clostridia bacterium]|nr:glutamine synthetase III [Clostridia bacterium]
MGTITEVFATSVFSDKVMKQRLPADVYAAMKRTIHHAEALDPAHINTVAAAMKDWAISMGCTHFSHWFQPLTASTAEKHDSFLLPKGGMSAIEAFTGKNLLQSEPDASSFPSGGLRGTCNARGYSVWDPTSYAFVKNKCLYIPACFVSYTGEAMDKKIPLLRSVEALSKEAVRLLHLCGKTDVHYVRTTAGPEQEYFLIPYDLYLKRKDLQYTGRTLFGAKPSKGQELDDQYFAAIKSRVKAFMEDCNIELWKLGINATTEHNEAAPCQHELAPIFDTTNISNDTNRLALDVMKTVAERHGLACLFHEKPFAGINGSGKHNNWSMATDQGENLLNPTADPYHNTQFLLFLAAAIQSVSDYSELLRVSIATAGNDHRLGALEAPPAILSVYLGDELTAVVNAIADGKKYVSPVKTTMSVGVAAIPELKKDTTDRNRTSPFAFTGNKFEFRMSGASQSISEPNMVLNTIMAETLKKFADRLERAKDFETAARKLIREVFKAQKDHIIFNGNGYSKEWQEEAARRGLPNHATTPEAISVYDKPAYVKLFADHGVLTPAELRCRKEVMFENYFNQIKIEAQTMCEMVIRDILPACFSYSTDLSVTDCSAAAEIGARVNALADTLYTATKALEEALAGLKTAGNAEEKSYYTRDVIRPAMKAVRVPADELETIVGRDYWPIPTYGDILYY